jgi:hypothetical protein
MGIESTFACNMLKKVELEKIGDSRFRTFRQPMMSGVSLAQRSPRQRFRSSRLLSKFAWLEGSVRRTW